MKAQFQGRLFGPGLPGVGVAVSARWFEEDLSLLSKDFETQVAATEMSVESSGFNDAHLRISWSTDDGDFSLLLNQQDARASFAAGAPLSLASCLQGIARHEKRQSMRRRWGWGVLVALLLLPVAVLVGFFLKADAVANWLATHIPVEQEAKIGELTLAQVRAQTPLLETGVAVEAVRDIGKRLTAGSRYQYRWFVADAKDVNAFAAPGGVVVVYAGLIRQADSAEELAGVLAHEVAHVELRHSLKGAIKNLGFRAVLALVSGDWSGTVVGDLTAQLSGLKFSRDAESEADHEGLRLLLKANISPFDMPRFFEKLAKQENATSEMLSLLATHPSSSSRMNALESAMSTLPNRHFEPLPIDWSVVKQSLSRQP